MGNQWKIKRFKYIIVESVKLFQDAGLYQCRITLQRIQGTCHVHISGCETNSISTPLSQSIPPCNKTELPIDGQLYLFRYNVSGKPLVLSANNRTYLTYINDIALVAFSYYVQPDEPTWTDDVEPIFRQYERVFPVMRGIVRLGSYNDVTSPHSIHLINYSMSLDIKHPGYMPVSRNLSPSKRTMILKWINQVPRPKYSPKVTEVLSAGICSNTKIVHSPNYWKQHFLPERCHACPIEPELSDMYFQRLFTKGDFSSVCRPLFGYNRRNDECKTGICSLETLRRQLQLAIELEFHIQKWPIHRRSYCFLFQIEF